MTKAAIPEAEHRRVASDIAATAQLACLLEASAPKPGNVSPGQPFADMRYEDFLASAVAIGEPLAGAADRPLGATIRLAVEATARWTGVNTNLGIVLLLAPLIKGIGGRFMRTAATGRSPVPSFHDLRPDVRAVLDAASVQDARDVYVAIRRASPGGLGHAEAQDVANEPTMTLTEAMRLAAHRDGIAREYATAFETTFGIGAPALARARQDGLSWDDAIVETFLILLAHAPDTHIARRSGEALAQAVSSRANDVLAEGGVRSAAGRQMIGEMDRVLRQDSPARANAGNPGTTADLTAAAIFLQLLREGSRARGFGGGHAGSR
jgi:triphosphoribosyl-dephospho-CoA synthase